MMVGGYALILFLHRICTRTCCSNTHSPTLTHTCMYVCIDIGTRQIGRQSARTSGPGRRQHGRRSCLYRIRSQTDSHGPDWLLRRPPRESDISIPRIPARSSTLVHSFLQTNAPGTLSLDDAVGDSPRRFCRSTKGSSRSRCGYHVVYTPCGKQSWLVFQSTSCCVESVGQGIGFFGAISVENAGRIETCEYVYLCV